MDYLYNLYTSFINVETNRIETLFDAFVYHGTFFASYFMGRLLLKNILKDTQVQKETISRICSSLSQVYIIHQLVFCDCKTSIHAFVSYLMNDMLYSIAFQEPLQTIIYVHHVISMLISCTGLYIYYTKPKEDFDFKNCYIISVSLLGMEISAPLLSLFWILKREPYFLHYKDKILFMLYPALFLSYVIFRLILPQFIFLYLVYTPWKTELFFYSSVFFCILGLYIMQIFWFMKLFFNYV